VNSETRGSGAALPALPQGGGLAQFLRSVAARFARPHTEQLPDSTVSTRSSVVIGAEGGPPHARVKVASVPACDELIAVEASWLKRLEADPLLAPHVPRLLGEGVSLNGRRYLMTTIASGTPGGADLRAPHLAFLKALAEAGPRHASFGNSSCFQGLETALGQIDIDADALDMLQAGTRDCWLALSTWSGPFVIGHGNFAPGSVLLTEHGLFVADWEHARTGANPLGDVFNYLLAPAARSKTQVPRRLLMRALRKAESAAHAIYPGRSWPRTVISGLALAYLLECVIAQTRLRRPAAAALATGYWRLLERRSDWMTR
jgi:hypothetical protein